MREPGGAPIAPPPVYYYRRDLSTRDLLPALGVAIGAGLAAFYLARLMLERTPLDPRPPRPPRPSAARDRGASAAEALRRP